MTNFFLLQKSAKWKTSNWSSINDFLSESANNHFVDISVGVIYPRNALCGIVIKFSSKYLVSFLSVSNQNFQVRRIT